MTSPAQPARPYTFKFFATSPASLASTMLVSVGDVTKDITVGDGLTELDITEAKAAVAAAAKAVSKLLPAPVSTSGVTP